MSTDLTNSAAAPRDLITAAIATRSTDPRFYSALNVLPNPDPILRRLGRAPDVYDAIAHDAHVIGDLRSVRAGLLGYEHRVVPGGDSRADRRAAELCQAYMQQPPAPGVRWPDRIWSLALAVFQGTAAHEVEWQRFGDVILPAALRDVPMRRIAIGTDDALRLLTREQPLTGADPGAYRLLVTRHMPTYDNPYGLAVFSGCFWPYTFKHAGFKYFAKFCQKYGIPWAIGRYPEGTSDTLVQELAQKLAAMVEDGVAAIPGDGRVELLETKSTGEPIQLQMIHTCNAEMSKAITSQTLASELQRGSGSRAAAETHAARQQAVAVADRDLVADSMSELFAWITTINVRGANPPRFEFYEEHEARSTWTDVLDKARGWLPIPQAFAYQRLQIPQPAAGEPVLPAGTVQAPIAGKVDPAEFSFSAAPLANDLLTALTDQAAAAVAPATDALIDRLAALIERYEREGKSLDNLETALAEIYPDLDLTQIGEITGAAMEAAYLHGMDQARA